MFEIVEIPKITDFRGSLTFIQDSDKLGFNIESINIINNINTIKPYCALNFNQLMIVLKGKVQLSFFDGTEKKYFTLDKPNLAIKVENFSWIEMNELFDNNSVMLIIKSKKNNLCKTIIDYKLFCDEISKS